LAQRVTNPLGAQAKKPVFRRQPAKIRFMALAPKNIQQIGNELAIQWSDGGESYLDLELLRRACPCAACGGEPDVLGNVLRPEVSHTDASFQLDSFVVVGGYALQPRWHDGHNTGIYSFQYLRRLSSSTTSG
jgi:DUF971 family protein